MGVDDGLRAITQPVSQSYFPNAMHETPADVAALQELLDRSYAGAGEHLLRIHTPDRRLTSCSVNPS